MAVIYSYPELEIPVLSDLLLITDVSDKNKTKRITLETLKTSLNVPNNIIAIKPLSAVSTGGNIEIQLTGINGFGTAGQILAVNENEDGLVYSSGGGSISVKDADTSVDPTEKVNFDGKIYTVTQDGTDNTQANIAGAYNTLIGDATPVAKDVGAIDSGTLASTLKGNDIVDLFDKMFFPTLPPVYFQPELEISNDLGSVLQEVGSTVTNTVTINFIRKDSGGFIGGTMTLSRNTPSASLTPTITTSQINPLPEQFTYPNTNNPQYKTTGVKSDLFTISNNLSNPVNTITYTATAGFGAGNQLKNSVGVFSGPPIPQGSKTATTSFEAIYPYFWGVSDILNAGDINFSSTGYANSIAAIKTVIQNGTGLGYNKVLAKSNSTLTVPFGTNPPTSTTWMWFAYPAGNTTKTRWFVDDTNKGDIAGTAFNNNSNLFSSPTTVQITTNNAPIWGPIDYNIHIALKSAGLDSVELRNN